MLVKTIAGGYVSTEKATSIIRKPLDRNDSDSGPNGIFLFFSGDWLPVCLGIYQDGNTARQVLRDFPGFGDRNKKLLYEMPTNEQAAKLVYGGPAV